MNLNNLLKRQSEKRRAKRVGRGYGSGKGGHTVGRGSKGQKARAGTSSLHGFEGGNVPLLRRLPKFRGFKNFNAIKYEPVNLIDLEKNFKDGETVTLESLKEKGLIKHNTKHVKILGKGELKKKLVFSGVNISSQTLERLKKQGSEINDGLKKEVKAEAKTEPKKEAKSEKTTKTQKTAKPKKSEKAK